VGNEVIQIPPHGRECVKTLENPTNGSWWIVQVRPTKKTRWVGFEKSHQRQLVDYSSPTYFS
jgi:hypothetical protein